VNDLSAEAIARELDLLGSNVGRPLTVAPVTASTNDDARAAAARGAPHGAAFVADAQTRGRGRGGHAWHSPAGENLYFSMVARPRVSAGSIPPVALAVGVAVARVLEQVVMPVWVKWPNDVLAGPDRKKLAGVLVEGQLRGSEVTSVVAGVGVNVHATSFPPDIVARATSLALLGVAGRGRSMLAARLLAAVGEAIARLEESGLTSFSEDLARLDALRGARVEVSGVRGTAEGMDGDGRLLVRTEHGITPVVAGQVDITAWG
jgi:BirA family biotin operon repressor/biotin-[acetyl-CoA-carboxylase] ligase